MAKQRRGKDTRIKLVGADITFSVYDSQHVEMIQSLDHYSDGARDFSPVYEEFSQYHQRSIWRNFEHEGRPRPWPPLQPSTIRDRLRQGYAAGPILVRSGRLKRSFRFSWGPRSYRVKNLAPYFGVHQYGAPAANIPERAMVVLLAQDKAQFTRIARKHLIGE